VTSTRGMRGLAGARGDFRRPRAGYLRDAGVFKIEDIQSLLAVSAAAFITRQLPASLEDNLDGVGEVVAECAGEDVRTGDQSLLSVRQADESSTVARGNCCGLEVSHLAPVPEDAAGEPPAETHASESSKHSPFGGPHGGSVTCPR
jgi:hypothetical protein